MDSQSAVVAPAGVTTGVVPTGGVPLVVVNHVGYSFMASAIVYVHATASQAFANNFPSARIAVTLNAPISLGIASHSDFSVSESGSVVTSSAGVQEDMLGIVTLTVPTTPASLAFKVEYTKNLVTSNQNVVGAGGAMDSQSVTVAPAIVTTGVSPSGVPLVALPAACNASFAPTNGAVGNCPVSLAHGLTCQANCSTGYTLSGLSSCSFGLMASAICWPTQLTFYNQFCTFPGMVTSDYLNGSLSASDCQVRCSQLGAQCNWFTFFTAYNGTLDGGPATRCYISSSTCELTYASSSEGAITFRNEKVDKTLINHALNKHASTSMFSTNDVGLIIDGDRNLGSWKSNSSAGMINIDLGNRSYITRINLYTSGIWYDNTTWSIGFIDGSANPTTIYTSSSSAAFSNTSLDLNVLGTAGYATKVVLSLLNRTQNAWSVVELQAYGYSAVQYVQRQRYNELKCQYQSTDRTHLIYSATVAECAISCANTPGCLYFSSQTVFGGWCIGCKVPPSESEAGARSYQMQEDTTTAKTNTTISQTVTFSGFSAGQWTSNLKTVGEHGYGATLGIYDLTLQRYEPGCSVTSSAVDARRSGNVQVTFQSVVDSSHAASASASATSATSSTLSSNIQTAAQGSTVTSAPVGSIGTPTVATPPVPAPPPGPLFGPDAVTCNTSAPVTADPVESTWQLAAVDVCFDATSAVGKSFMSAFGGSATGMKLRFKSGQLTCNVDLVVTNGYSYWGCGTLAKSYPRQAALAVSVKDASATIYPQSSDLHDGAVNSWYCLNGHNSLSDSLSFLGPATITKGKVYYLRYNDAVTDSNDNSGITCADVYFKVPTDVTCMAPATTGTPSCCCCACAGGEKCGDRTCCNPAATCTTESGDLYAPNHRLR